MEEVERNQNMTHQELHFNPFTPLPTEEDESKYEKYFELESSYMAASGYSKNRDAFLFRDRAVLLISKVSSLLDINTLCFDSVFDTNKNILIKSFFLIFFSTGNATIFRS